MLIKGNNRKIKVKSMSKNMYNYNIHKTNLSTLRSLASCISRILLAFSRLILNNFSKLSLTYMFFN